MSKGTDPAWDLAHALIGVTRHDVVVACNDVGVKLAYVEQSHAGSDGTRRKSHYGSGRQPWDDILDLGWAPHFASGNILKYLRRTKDPEDVDDARWYWNRLRELVDQELTLRPGTRTHCIGAGLVMQALMRTLTPEELGVLGGLPRSP